MATEKTDRNEAIIAAYRDEKKTLREIAVAHDLSHERVRQIVARVPGLLRTNRFTRRKDVDQKTLEKLVAKGLKMSQIAEVTGMAETNLRVRLHSAGLKLAPGRRRVRKAA